MFPALLSSLVLSGQVHISVPVNQYPWGYPGYPHGGNIIIVQPQQVQPPVLVEFDALGKDWGSVWINGEEVYRPKLYNRRQVLNLAPGSYRVVLTGITKYDVWSAGYLNVGRTGTLRVVFSKTNGVYVQGDPSAWLGDRDVRNGMEVWRR
ncbi:hypothetical protein H6F90_05630 [Trichocoleus sp. FACHB-591]|uniref:hypothetical protein n=1 Tax=Trichocoleus sp. FACHB-591 TaxID=2692872 RepID=UPI001689009D|nr:hypothetical protein [Trichocoleus sp. FACHB-591]MBD2094630.1 hypothetical protein [Trichocoleus sp. FACHB-591]